LQIRAPKLADEYTPSEAEFSRLDICSAVIMSIQVEILARVCVYVRYIEKPSLTPHSGVTVWCGGGAMQCENVLKVTVTATGVR
jgi:hypothetical protein